MEMIVYSRKSCGPCRTLAYFLDKNNAKYEVRDVDDPKYTKEWLKHAQTVPVVVKGDRVIVGLNLSVIKSML